MDFSILLTEPFEKKMVLPRIHNDKYVKGDKTWNDVWTGSRICYGAAVFWAGTFIANQAFLPNARSRVQYLIKHFTTVRYIQYLHTVEEPRSNCETSLQSVGLRARTGLGVLNHVVATDHQTCLAGMEIKLAALALAAFIKRPAANRSAGALILIHCIDEEGKKDGHVVALVWDKNNPEMCFGFDSNFGEFLIPKMQIAGWFEHLIQQRYSKRKLHSFVTLYLSPETNSFLI